MFTQGQKVVCIDDNIPIKWLQFVHPIFKNKVYTIRDIVPGSNTTGTLDGPVEIAVYLKELINTVNDAGIERGYNAERFAPLQESPNKVVREKELIPA